MIFFPSLRQTLVVVALVAASTVCAQPAIHYHTGTTRKVSQLTGDWDQPYGIPTLSQTNTRADFWATDLGSTVEHDGKLYFLFGDTWGGRGGLLDTLGHTTSNDPWNVTMDVPLARDGKWAPILPNGLDYAEFSVPSHGISHGGSLYAVFTQPSGFQNYMRRSYMIVSHDNGYTWQTLYELDNGNPADPVFVNVWFERRDGFIYMFGSGHYRESSPTLARVPEGQFPTKSAWQYFRGHTSGGGTIWGSRAIDSAFLFNHDQLGEFSVCWVEQLGCWVMLYNSMNPRGIVMRTAYQPTGPWSSAQVILNPGQGPYGDYMHIGWGTMKMDLMSDPGREQEFGGEYGPYLIPRYITGTAQHCELYYTMSTWNPYQVLIMKSVVGTVPRPSLPFALSRNLPNSNWQRYPANVADEFTRGGVPHITTFTEEEQDASRGWLWQRLPPGTQRVSFDIHGGHSEVFLLENFTGMPEFGDVDFVSAQLRSGAYGRVVRRATGVDDNNIEIPWDWNTTAYNMNSLGVVVLDTHDELWGFVSLSRLTVRAPLVPSSVDDWTLY